MKFHALIVSTAICALSAMPAAAEGFGAYGSGKFDIPGKGKAEMSAGTSIKNTPINIDDNSVDKVMVGGGEGSGGSLLSGVSAKLEAEAVVNSVSFKGSKIEGGAINVRKNRAPNVTAYGGKTTVNSLVAN